MATDIVGSLFGVTPEMFQQRQAALADKQAIEFAQLTPIQQAQAGIYRGAYGLAGALGGALGAQDPQLQLISTRNSIAQQIDYNNPESIMQGVRSLSQAGDTVGAMQLADVARKMESEIAQRFQRTAAGQASLAQANRERATSTPADIAKAARIGELVNALQTPDLDEMTRANLQAQLDALRPATKESKEPTTNELTNARAIALQAGPVGSPEYNTAFRAEYNRLTAPKDAREPTTNELTNARALAAQAGPVGSPEYNAAFMAEYNRLTTPKESKLPSVGGDREAVALEVYNAPFASLTPEQRAAVNKRVEAQQAAKTPKVEVRNVMPGDTKLADIPAFRASVQKTIDPQLKAITTSQQALQAIDDSLATGNFASYRAAQVQFAKAIAGAGDLSQKELKAAGADPSLLGGAADYLSTIFSSTPTADTQRKIRSTLQAIQTVARKQARGEVDQQRKIALRSPGYNVEAVNEALMFPQLQSDTIPTPAVTGGDLAAAAAAELARRRGGK
jgi:hypothetical protein